MTTIAIVDDHELLAETVRLALAGSGVAAQRVPPREPQALVQALVEDAPDLVLLDLDLGEYGDATPLIGPLVSAGIRVLVVTGSTDPLRVAAALEQGAIGYQAKSDGFDTLVAKARTALVADAPLDPGERLRMLTELSDARASRAAELAPFERLTDREQATLRALAQGRSAQQIAQAWVVSEATVRSHVRAVLIKLDVTSQLAAVARALDVGWLDEPAAG